MDGALTLVELDRQVAAIGRESSRRIELVPHVRQHGDWPALARRNREILAILEESRARVGALRPPLDRTGAYGAYLAGLDRQLVLERVALRAAEAGDMQAYRDAARTLAAALGEIQALGVRAGLRSTRMPLTRRLSILLSLPWVLLKAHRQARREQRAGRSWQ